jgi:hypothetical protein
MKSLGRMLRPQRPNVILCSLITSSGAQQFTSIHPSHVNTRNNSFSGHLSILRLRVRDGKTGHPGLIKSHGAQCTKAWICSTFSPVSATSISCFVAQGFQILIDRMVTSVLLPCCAEMNVPMGVERGCRSGWDSADSWNNTSGASGSHNIFSF